MAKSSERRRTELSTLFSILFTLFFIYVFPPIFSYLGHWGGSPWLGTAGLALGLLGWLSFCLSILRNYIFKPSRLLRQLRANEKSGHAVQARVLSKSLLSRNRDGSEVLELRIVFRNLANTEIESKMTLTDSRPEEDRFAKDRLIKLRLNTDLSALPYQLEGASYRRKFIFPILWVLFNLLFAVTYFLISYRLYSKGMGWRFMVPWYPWVWQPYLGILLGKGVTAFGKRGMSIELEGLTKVSDMRQGNALHLYGILGEAEITAARQSGVFINEQPEISYSINFRDRRGQTHYHQFKKITSLLDLHRFSVGEMRPVLYLPDDPDVFIIR